MHLKNFSLIRRPEKIELSPCYDLINSSIVLHTGEELALPLKGKKSNLHKEHLVDYYGLDRLKLNPAVINTELDLLRKIQPEWLDLIKKSFLTKDLQQSYVDLLKKRSEILF